MIWLTVIITCPIQWGRIQRQKKRDDVSLLPNHTWSCTSWRRRGATEICLKPAVIFSTEHISLLQSQTLLFKQRGINFPCYSYLNGRRLIWRPPETGLPQGCKVAVCKNETQEKTAEELAKQKSNTAHRHSKDLYKPQPMPLKVFVWRQRRSRPIYRTLGLGSCRHCDRHCHGWLGEDGCPVGKLPASHDSAAATPATTYRSVSSKKHFP